MLHLETLLEHLVDDLLRALRSASLDELSELLAGDTPAERGGLAPRPKGVRRVRRKPIRKPPPDTLTPGRARRQPAKKPAKKPGPHAPHLADITDPERLLAGPAKGIEEPDTQGTHSAERESPPSVVRPAGDTRPRLQIGESLARSHGSGVVIRRAKIR